MASPPKSDGTASGFSVDAAGLPEDRETILALWSTGLARAGVAEAKLQWYYERNPEGMPRVFFLRQDGSARAVGVATVGTRRMRLGSENLVAGFLADFVVEPTHRGFFPALFLQRELLRREQQARTVVFGLPNARSEAVVRRAGFRFVGSMVRRVRVLRSRDYLSSIVPPWLSGHLGAAIDHFRHAAAWLRRLGTSSDYEWQWRDTPDADFDALWERVAPSGTLIGVRDSAFLAWRFVEVPLPSHRFFALISKDDRKLVAYAVCHAMAGAMCVADFLVDPGAPGAGKRLWLDLAREAHRLGHRSLSVDFLGSEAVRGELDAAGLIAREERPLYAAFDARYMLSSASNWYVTSADEDA